MSGRSDDKYISNLLGGTKIVQKGGGCKLTSSSYKLPTNKFMIDSISRELKIKKNQVLFSISDYGNTSSASIPLTLCKNLDKIQRSNKICVLGFGAGFSYAAAILDLKNTKILKINKKKF